MSIEIDPRTRASGISLRGGEDPAYLFADHLRKAIELYQRAISQDPNYVYAYNNLACALILRGEEGDAYKAIALLKDSLKIEPARSDTLNSLGVAFYYAENPARAKDCLLEALKVDPAYDLSLFNLGRLALQLGNESECRKYWSEYLKIDKKSPWAAVARKFLGIESPNLLRPVLPQRREKKSWGWKSAPMTTTFQRPGKLRRPRAWHWSAIPIVSARFPITSQPFLKTKRSG